ncbi:hypothetical protein [Nibribacter ruber]|nr:hypothetical protein [Nibribacter ruber]
MNITNYKRLMAVLLVSLVLAIGGKEARSFCCRFLPKEIIIKK